MMSLSALKMMTLHIPFVKKAAGHWADSFPTASESESDQHGHPKSWTHTQCAATRHGVIASLCSPGAKQTVGK